MPTAGGRSTRRSRSPDVPLGLLEAPSATDATFRVLGPLEAHRGNRTCNLGGRRQKMVLAVLLANANRVVSRDALIEAVWAGSPPSAAKTSLHTYLSHLRAEMGRDVIEHADGGYLMAVDRDELDALQFAHLVEVGGARLSEDPKDAAECLDRALQLWRGSAFGELGCEPALLVEVAHLSELRLAAEEKRIDAHLMLGHHEMVTRDLVTLVRENPYRERLQGQLMLALYRSGRQADALRSFADARRCYADELGIDPSPHLWSLEERILTHDSSLLFPAEKTVAVMAAELESTSRRFALPDRAVATLTRPPPRPPLETESPSGLWSDDKRHPRRSRRRGIAASVSGALLVGGLAALLPWGVGWERPDAPRSECLSMSVLPTGWWPGDSTSADVMAAHDATLVGHSDYGEGLVDEGFALSGLGYVDIPHDPELDIGTNDFSLDLWVRFDSTQGEQILAEKWIQKFGTTSVGWTFTKHAHNSLGFYTEGPYGAFGVSSDQLRIPTDRWIHVAAVRRSDTLELFLGGLLVASYEEKGSSSYDIRSASSIKLGHRGDLYDTPGSADSRGMYLAGEIDEVHIWSGTALSFGEIRGLVEARDEGVCPPD